MLNLPGINDAQYYTGSTVSTESLNRADAQMRNLLRVGGQLFDMAINAAQINEAVATGQATRASVEGLYGNILGANGRVIRTSMEGVSDMASDAWEALKNWIKEMIRKVQDFFLKYSVFIKRTKESLKKLKSYVSSRLESGKMEINTDSESIKDRYGDEKILSIGRLMVIETTVTKVIALSDDQLNMLFEMLWGQATNDTIVYTGKTEFKKKLNEKGGEIEDRYFKSGTDMTIMRQAAQRYKDRSQRTTETASTPGLDLEDVFKHVDSGEVSIRLDSEAASVLDEMLDPDGTYKGTANGITLTELNGKTELEKYLEGYYKFADEFIKNKDKVVKEFKRGEDRISRGKGQFKSNGLRSIRAIYHATLLVMFKISSAFRKSATKLTKYVYAVLRVKSV